METRRPEPASTSVVAATQSAPCDSTEWTTPGVTGVEESESAAPAKPAGAVTLQQLKDAWPQVLDHVQKAKRAAWMVVFTATVRKFEGDVLTLTFPSDAERDSFRPVPGQADGASELLRQAILDLLGVRVKFVALTAAAFAASLKEQFADAVPAAPSAEEPPAEEPAPAPKRAPAAGPAPAPKEPLETKAAPATSWPTAVIPGSVAPALEPEPDEDREPEPDPEPRSERPALRAVPKFEDVSRYGEAVVREILDARFIEEQPLDSPSRPATAVDQREAGS